MRAIRNAKIVIGTLPHAKSPASGGFTPMTLSVTKIAAATMRIRRKTSVRSRGNAIMAKITKALMPTGDAATANRTSCGGVASMKKDAISTTIAPANAMAAATRHP